MADVVFVHAPVFSACAEMNRKRLRRNQSMLRVLRVCGDEPIAYFLGKNIDEVFSACAEMNRQERK